MNTMTAEHQQTPITARPWAWALRLKSWDCHIFAPRVWREFGYLWAQLFISCFALTYVILVPSLAGGLLVTVVGLYVVGFLILGARGWGTMYRALDRNLLNSDIAAPPAFVAPKGFWRRLGAMLGDTTGWRALAYMLTSFQLAVVAFSVSLSFFAAGLGGITFWFWSRWLPEQRMFDGTYQRAVFFSTSHSYWAVDTPGRLALVALLGVVFLVLWPLINRGFTNAFRALGKSHFGPTAGSIRVAQLRRQRAVVVEGADARLRRIERELHDGTQARLVSVAMQLGEARELLTTNPGVAAELLDTAHASTKDALTELRDIARGIHPAALDDGLAIALETLAARTPLPITVDLTPDVEAALTSASRSLAYYTVAELLTNVVKHAHATGAYVLVEKSDATTLRLRVRDDGLGGAMVAPGVPGSSGSGLAGLAERITAVDGTFTLTSPQGGPTVVDVTLPIDVSA